MRCSHLRWRGGILAVPALLLLAGAAAGAGAGDGRRVPEAQRETAPPRILGTAAGQYATPGSTVSVSGEHLGLRGGELRLVGHFPDHPHGRHLPLEIVDWRDDGVKARVPADLEGVVDQKVRVELERQDGMVAAGREVAFRARRVTQRMPSRGFLDMGCDLGKDAGGGCALYPEPDDVWAQMQASSISCQHEANRCLNTHSGTDVYRTRKLRNGWEFVQARIGGGDAIEKVVGASGHNVELEVSGGPVTVPLSGTEVHAVRVSWSLGPGGLTNYTIALDIEGPAGVDPFEQVEIAGAAEIPPLDLGRVVEPPPDLRIVAPSEDTTIPPDASHVELVLEADAPSPSWTVELEWWVHGDRSGDIAGAPAPVPGPRIVRWSDLPVSVPVASLGGLGKHSVRARVRGGPNGGWTEPRSFWIGVKAAGNTSATSSLDDGEPAPQALPTHQEKASEQGQAAPSSLPTRREQGRTSLGDQARMGLASSGATAGGPGSSPGGLAARSLARGSSFRIRVQGVQRAGSPLDLVVEFSGEPEAEGRIQLECRAQGEGHCAVPESPLATGGFRRSGDTWTLPQAIRPDAAGSYRVRFTIGEASADAILQVLPALETGSAGAMTRTAPAGAVEPPDDDEPPTRRPADPGDLIQRR